MIVGVVSGDQGVPERETMLERMQDTACASIPWDCGYVDSDWGRIFRAYGLSEGRPTPTVLVCNPLGEEAKSSFSVLSRFSERIWRRGWSVARFDYLGTGDSEGDFYGTGPRDWLRDGRRVLNELSGLAAASRFCFLGPRLGANVAARLALEVASEGQPAGLVLWEPILNMGKYVRHLGWANRDPGHPEAIDHYGWRLSRKCVDAIRETLLLKAEHLERPALVGHVSSRRKLSPEFEGLRDRLRPDSRFVHVRSRPFWEPIGQSSCEELLDETLAWMAGWDGG